MTFAADVIDLGCGTGWLLDHCKPHSYLGIDASAGMLARLIDKHPFAKVAKATVGDPGWTDEIITRPIGSKPRATVVTATWAAHEFGRLDWILADLTDVVPGCLVALHGQAPRYRHRSHYVLADDDVRGYLRFTPRACREAAGAVGARLTGCWGTGACPDRLAHHRAVWHAFLAAPTRVHYAFLAVWRLASRPK